MHERAMLLEITPYRSSDKTGLLCTLQMRFKRQRVDGVFQMVCLHECLKDAKEPSMWLLLWLCTLVKNPASTLSSKLKYEYTPLRDSCNSPGEHLGRLVTALLGVHCCNGNRKSAGPCKSRIVRAPTSYGQFITH
jgi:hypothetical protein